MYKVYRVDSLSGYSGYSLVAANDAKEANAYVEEFKKQDKDNRHDSWGYYSVDESDIIDGLWSEFKGFVIFGVYYSG